MRETCFMLCPTWVRDAHREDASQERVNATSTFPGATCVLWDSHCAAWLWVTGMAVLFVLLLCYLRTLLVRVAAATGGEGLAVSRWFLCAESLTLT